MTSFDNLGTQSMLFPLALGQTHPTSITVDEQIYTGTLLKFALFAFAVKTLYLVGPFRL